MKDLVLQAIASPELDLERVKALVSWQMDRIDAYGALAKARGFEPRLMQSWLDIPPIFTAAFKRHRLFSGSDAVAEFRTSGTSGTSFGRSLFSHDGLEVMAEAIRENATRHLFPDATVTRIAVLAPPPTSAPHLIMSWGMQRLVDQFGAIGSGFFVGPDGIKLAELVQVFESSDEPITLIGASFGFVHLLDTLDARGWSTTLPARSRIMDAGGFKGRSRTVSRSELAQGFERVLGVPESHHINLLGMTELASQFYDNTFSKPNGPRLKVNPPWTATAAFDPVTMEAVPDGEVGILRHLDMANLDRPCVIQTDDLGRCYADGFEVLGRAVNTSDRGCSITVDALVGGAA